MGDEGTNRAEEPVEEVRNEIGNLGRELQFFAATRPLFSTALSAQLQQSLYTFGLALSRSLTADVGVRLAAQLAAMPLVDTSKLVASIRGALSTPGLREALNLNISPAFRALTNASTYSQPDPPKAFYSPAMTSSGAYFARDEAVVDSFDGLNRAISALIAKVPELQLVWRGHRDASWGVHSALFRSLMVLNGVKSPNDRPTSEQPYPDEEQMVAAEREMLRAARTDWRFDGTSALETFARIQHFGGPTRLLDVTKNPFIAAWFAVEGEPDRGDEADGRLLAFATTPVLNGETEAASFSTLVELDAEWGDRTPPWHRWSDATARQSVDWGTGARRRVWVPPAYDPRISAQNAAFLLDGVPITTAKTRSYFRSGTKPATYWSRADLLAAGSIYVKTFSPIRKPRPNRHNFAPTFTFRISASAKAEIREVLTSRFGYTRSYIYPDFTALAQYVANMRFPALGAP